MRALAFGALLIISVSGCAPVEEKVTSASSTETTRSKITDVAMPAVGSKGHLFVANKRGNTLSKIDLATGRVVESAPVCKNPHELTLIEQDILVAVACYGGQTIEAFRAKDLQLIQRIQLGKNARPHGIVWQEKDSAIFVTAEGRQSIMRVDGALSRSPKVTEFKTGQDGSHMIAVAPDANAAWTTDLGSKTVTRIDLTGDRPLPLHVTIGEEPEGIALSPDGGTLWVTARKSNKAFALDPKTLAIRAELDTGRFPLRLAIRPQGDFAVTSNLADGGLTVIDLGEGEVVRQIAVSSAAEAEARQQVTILWSNDGNRIYVAETGTDTVAEVDFASGKVLRRLKTGKGGDGMAIMD